MSLPRALVQRGLAHALHSQTHSSVGGRKPNGEIRIYMHGIEAGVPGVGANMQLRENK